MNNCKVADFDGSFEFKKVPLNSIDKYRIVFPSNDGNAEKIAGKLQKYYKDLNLNFPVVSDNSDVSDKEILIGKTNRKESNKSISVPDLEVSFKNQKLVFDGGHYVTLQSAVEKFIRLEPKPSEVYVFKITTDFKDTVLDGYEYVWGDEFDGTELDMTKWDFEARMKGTGKIEISWDKEVIDIGDGKLKLHAVNYKKPNHESTRYKVPYSVVTKYKMNFTYGYAEIRARLPFFEGAWPSFWGLNAGGDTRNCPSYNKEKDESRLYDSEVDIFEVFGHKSKVIPNIHKWYFTDRLNYGEISGEEGCRHTMLPEGDKLIWDWEEKNADLEKLSYEYHTYGFEWTDKEMMFYVDGTKYYTLNIVNTFDMFDDMSGFHSPIFLMFNNHVFADDLSWYGSLVKDHSLLPFCYYIDYIRVYQKPGVGELYIDDEPNSYEGR